jgi:hypothetical protein
MAYRKALGFPETLEGEGKDRNQFANDLAHDLAMQTPDLGEFVGEERFLFEDFKNAYRNQELKAFLESSRLFGWLSGGSGAENLANVVFPYRDKDSLTNRMIDRYKHKSDDFIAKYRNLEKGSGRDQTSIDQKRPFVDSYRLPWRSFLDLPDRADAQGYNRVARYLDVLWPGETLNSLNIPSKLDASLYWDYLNYSLSVIDPYIIFPGESLKDMDPYSVDTSVTNPKEHPYPMPTYITPLASSIRRQIKDINDDLEDVPTGWFRVGRKKDVPHDACYVGHYRDCYVWVGRDGLEGLSKPTLTVLNFSSLIRQPTRITTPGPRYTPSNAFPAP